MNLYLPTKYQINAHPNYCSDDFHGYYFQWGAYQKLIELAQLKAATTLIDIGCGQAHKLKPYMNQYYIIGVDYGKNIDYCRQHYSGHMWLDLDLENDNFNIDQDILKSSVIICADVVEHLIDPSLLLTALRDMSDQCLAMVITTPDRQRLGSLEYGPPLNKHHVREWTLSEFESLLRSMDFPLKTIDYTVTDTARGTAYETITAVIENDL